MFFLTEVQLIYNVVLVSGDSKLILSLILSLYVRACFVCANCFSRAQLFETLWTEGPQAPLSMGIILYIASPLHMNKFHS